MRVTDRAGEEVQLALFSHDALHEMLTEERWKDVEIAYVSRTDYPEWAHECLGMISVKTPDGPRLSKIAKHFQIYPGRKTTHFERIHRDSGVPYEEMVRRRERLCVIL